jgi:hypothetical protein
MNSTAGVSTLAFFMADHTAGNMPGENMFYPYCKN